MNEYSEIVRSEALKLIRRHESHAQWIHEENVRRRRRTVMASPSQLPLQVPAHWQLARGFNPYLVRSSSDRIGRSIREAMRDRTYAPRSPTLFRVPKGEGFRDISLFQIADNALSRLVYGRLMDKNRPLFSARSYAYRRDLTAHDCLQFIRSEWNPDSRLFIAEYDFSQFFDSIKHDHIFRTLSDYGFLLTASEKHVVEAFLSAPLPVADGYNEMSGQRREVGVPQGTSISLFLANVAASPLDRALERLGVGFVRYADDTIIWSSDYSQICRAVEVLHREADRIGASLNLEKSEGIRLLIDPGASAEIRHVSETDYVGHAVSLGGLAIGTKSISAIKSRIHSLMFENLLRNPLDDTQDMTRLGRVDRDYVVFIWQLRRYLYGDLSESNVRAFQQGGTRLRRFKGVMAYYPLVDDADQLAELDRWLTRSAWLVMRRRARLLRQHGRRSLPPPHDLDIGDFVRYTRRSRTTGGVLDLRIPSFRRISDVIGAAARVYGPNRVGLGGMRYY